MIIDLMNILLTHYIIVPSSQNNSLKHKLMYNHVPAIEQQYWGQRCFMGRRNRGLMSEL